MKRRITIMVVICLGVGLLGAKAARAQFPGDNVVMMFEADNAAGFDTFVTADGAAREYPVADSTFAMTVGAIPGAFSANNVGNMQVVDSFGTGGFPFDDNFQDAGGLWSLNDPNFDVNDGLGEGLAVDFLLRSDSVFANVISSNILTDLVGLTLNAAQFGNDPLFPSPNFVWEVRYSPPLSPSEVMVIDFSSISFTAGSAANLVKVTFNGTVATNDITTPGSSLSIPEPATCSLLLAGAMLFLRRRR